ncbi:isochorismatase family protein [Paraburkholderia azotifigens]|uniref:Isochorismatase family protein n=1 Tax=Paraburkholderia azotifigens TaxID=2057004 RepID=A0A5C6VRG2_9BURK|nr:isochorismatase family protein [Paraburkholderia azotifigens]TXC87560.1 isochorismatase family protein [Paraburkholderia azotifigens]
MTQALSVDPRSTALVLIDLQHSNVARQLAPHSATDVVARSVRAADALRAAGGTVVFVRVDVAQLLSLPADAPLRPRDAPAPPPQASDLVPECNVQAGDVIVTKRQWGAFYGTDLEQQLRRRGIRTIALTGIATNFGVESTARAAFDQGYELIFIEDAMSGLSGDTHRFPIEHIFPRMGFVRSTEEFVSAVAENGTFGGA